MADTHGGHKLALLSPETVLLDQDEEGNPKPHTPQLTATQEYLWKLYTGHIEEVKKLAGKDPIHIWHDGDLTQGLKYPHHLVSTRLADQLAIGAYNLKPWLRVPNVKTLRIVTGTEAHNFGEGSAEIAVSEWLASEFPKTDVRVTAHGLMTIKEMGLEFDFSHHGPQSGSRSWLKGNVARFYLRDLMIREIENRGKPADIYVRAHYHEYVYEVLREGKFKSRLLMTPSYSMIDDHALKVTQSKHMVTNGLVAFELIDGRISEPIELMKTLDIRTKETV